MGTNQGIDAEHCRFDYDRIFSGPRDGTVLGQFRIGNDCASDGRGAQALNEKFVGQCLSHFYDLPCAPRGNSDSADNPPPTILIATPVTRPIISASSRWENLRIGCGEVMWGTRMSCPSFNSHQPQA